MSKYGLDLARDEEIVGLVRKSPSSQWRGIFFAVIWISIPFFFFFPLLAIGGFGFLFFALLELSGLVYAVKRWRIWRNTMVLITDRRVIDIDQIGFFKREVSEISIADVKDVETHRHTLRVRTSKKSGFNIEMKGVKRPKRVADLILEVQYLAQSHVAHAAHPSPR